MPRAVNNPEQIAMVREFFASLSRSERLRIYDFFKSRIGSTRTPGSGSTLEPVVREETRKWMSKQ
jgi:protein subunit release factor A